MTVEQAKQIKAQQKQLVARRNALGKALSVFTTVFNGNIAKTMNAAGLSEGATYDDVVSEWKKVDTEIKNLPQIPLNVFKQII